ncbi:uncharacterized protein LOC131237223 [Magnolia sinica]|uniref:uncharacterized protein LOC131237223 n=1 Tax=Magnolia sinica TaxID=86752 RepID=UPI002659B4BD|nr:uncharacterized protein LOC131237223 [Magnolia sinica]
MEVYMMKEIEVNIKCSMDRKSKSLPPPPPPPPPLPKAWAARQVTVSRSVTLEEIARFWKRKKMEEEDHLLEAQKTAARIRARNLTEENYKRFEDSLEEDMKDGAKKEENNKKDDDNREIRVGIKDWWTKSKYAYLNQPAILSMGPAKRTSTYIPNTCLFSAPPPQSAFLGFSR